MRWPSVTIWSGRRSTPPSPEIAPGSCTPTWPTTTSVLGEPLVAASHARAAATPGDLASALILVSAAETLASTSADDAGELAALAFGTVLPAQPEWLDLSRRCLSVLCGA